MDKKSKILFSIMFLLILVAVGLSYYRYMVKLDYFVQIQTDCDPAVESCFVSECTPEEDVECPAIESERISYYKTIMKKAYNLPDCDPNDENCPKVTCDNDPTCQEVLCDESTLSEGEACSVLDSNQSESL